MKFPKLQIEKKPYPPLRMRIFWPILSVLMALGFGAILIASAGVNPLVGYYHLFYGALGDIHAITETLWRFTPLLLTGTAVAIAFTCKFWNIGAEGQMLAGALVSSFFAISLRNIPSGLMIPLVLVSGFLGGAIWALIPAILKARFGVDDVVTTLLGNWIILYLVACLIEGPWRDPVSMWPESPPIASSARFPVLIPGHRLHFGFIIAILCSFLFLIILRKTRWGYQLKAVGANPKASYFTGINVTRVLITAAILSGGIAGFAGVNELCGTHFHLKGISQIGSIGELSWGYGYAGIFVAMMGGLSPVGVPLAAFFTAIIFQGSRTMYRTLGIPSPFKDAIIGITMVCILVGVFLTYYRIKREKR